MDNQQTPQTENGQSAGKFETLLRHDFPASVVVFLVAVPLCMGIAIASGAPVWTGLMTGIVGGLVVGVLGGQPLQVSGPAAGLTVIVYGVIQTHGLEMLGTVVLIGGLLQLIGGLAGLGQWFRAVSPAVIKGMLAGIGVLIFSSQFHVMLDRQPSGSGIKDLVTIPNAVAHAMVVPELGERSEREFKTEKLRTLGELHRRQQVLEQSVVEILPDRSDYKAWEKRTTRDKERDARQLRALNADQQDLLEKLRSEVAELRRHLEQMHNNSQEQVRNNDHTQDELLELGRSAIRDNEAALQALDAGQGREALQAQEQAVASLEKLMNALKSHNLAGMIGLLTIGLIVLWQTVCPERLKLIPAPLVAIVLATAVAAALSVPVLYIEVPNNIFGEINLPSIELLSGADWAGLLKSGVVVAIIASVETLLCATAVDQMQDKTRTNYDRELWAQGVGNSVCGIVGALPMTGVIVRSSTNVMAGARTRNSAILHGVWLVLFVSSLAFVLRLIPTAALAALLVFIGYRLVDRKAMRELLDHGWDEFGIYVATVGMIVVTDLLTGVITGVVLSGVKLLYTFSHLRTDLEVDHEQKRATLSLEGAATFIRLPRLAAALEQVPGDVELHVDFQQLNYIDHACLELLTSWAKQHESTGGKLVLDWESLHARFKPENGNGRQKQTEQATEAA